MPITNRLKKNLDLQTFVRIIFLKFHSNLDIKNVLKFMRKVYLEDRNLFLNFANKKLEFL